MNTKSSHVSSSYLCTHFFSCFDCKIVDIDWWNDWFWDGIDCYCGIQGMISDHYCWCMFQGVNSICSIITGSFIIQQGYFATTLASGVHPILVNSLKELLQIWHKRPLRLKADLLNLWWSKINGQGHRDFNWWLLVGGGMQPWDGNSS